MLQKKYCRHYNSLALIMLSGCRNIIQISDYATNEQQAVTNEQNRIFRQNKKHTKAQKMKNEVV